ncbi:MAG: exopolysaccharide biosynthesis protein [Pseudomonadota bacterium]
MPDASGGGVSMSADQTAALGAGKRAIPFLRDTLRALAAARSTEPLTENSADGEEDRSAAPRGARLGDMVDRLDERAFGLMLLFLALPCCLPFVYVLPQIVALPMLALAGQLAAGRHHPWLPKALADRRFDAGAFAGVLDRAERYVGWIEAVARPRLNAVTEGVGVRLVGVLLLAPCASILVPLPGTNTVPGIGVAITALGLIERDGAITCLGLVIGLLWVAALLIFGLEAASMLKDAISAML